MDNTKINPMKVALMTIFQVPNYGSVLQAYATQTLLEKMGYDCDIINYAYPNEWHYKKGLPRPSRLKEFIKKFLFALHLYDDHISNFRYERLNLTRCYKNIDDLNRENWSVYKALISGSDQVWNPRFHHADRAFMLSFCNDVKKIAISSSFACPSLPSDMIHYYRKWLCRFDAISVRENDGLNIINNQLHLDVPSCVMLDPTLLMSADEWTSELNLKRGEKKCKFLLLYILDYSFNPRPYILKIAEKMKKKYGCEKIITFSKKNSEEIRGLNAESVEGCSVEDFVNYFKEAEAVVTSSFHGTAFALNFSRPVISVCPNHGDERQRGLLNLLEIPDNGITVDSPVSDVDADYDTGKVQSALAGLREKHIQWIKNSLNG